MSGTPQGHVATPVPNLLPSAVLFQGIRLVPNALGKSALSALDLNPAVPDPVPLLVPVVPRRVDLPGARNDFFPIGYDGIGTRLRGIIGVVLGMNEIDLSLESNDFQRFVPDQYIERPSRLSHHIAVRRGDLDHSVVAVVAEPGDA